MPESAFRRVVNVRAETHTPGRFTNCLESASTRAPVRLFSARAPRQAVLRASFGLAPSLTTEPCDPTVEKMRDAFNRRLPPVRLACTRTSCVPDSLPQLSLRGRPVEFGLHATDQGILGFTTLEPLRRTVTGHFVLVASSPRAASVGVVFPRCQRCDRASDTPVATRRAPRFMRLRACDSRGCARLEREPSRRGHRDHRLVKGDGS